MGKNELYNYYNLNKRALEYYNSKEYFIGKKIVQYGNYLKKGRLLKTIGVIAEDIFRIVVKKKKNPDVSEIDVNYLYQGKKIAIYTAVFGNYDRICEPLYIDPNCDYYIFTDIDIPHDSVWKKRIIEFPEYVNTPFLKNRYVKMLPHIVLKEYDVSFYIDGNLQLVTTPSLYMKNFDSKIGIGMHKHPSNVNLFEEVKYNVKLNKITNEEAKTIRKLYKLNNMPKNYGMFECNAILRDSQNDICIKIMEQWWKAVFNGIKRDQLYFTFVLFKNNYKFNDVFLLGDNINSNPMFIRYSHDNSNKQ